MMMMTLVAKVEWGKAFTKISIINSIMQQFKYIEKSI